MKQEIDFINRIIKEAIKHGGDAGGSYDSNSKKLKQSIVDWLEFKGLSDEYEVKLVEVTDFFTYDYYQIVAIKQ